MFLIDIDSDIVRQLLLDVHIIAFALAMADVLREDWHMLWARTLDTARLAATAGRVKWFLTALWLTGVPLIGFTLDWDFSLLADRPKLVMKLLVVVALTANGALLHFVAFPLLAKGRRYGPWPAGIASVLGAISTVSWLYASFVGAARYVAPRMSFTLFVELYFAMLVCGVAVALLVMRQRVERMIAAGDGTPSPAVLIAGPQSADSKVAAFVELDVAMAAVGHAHRRLLSLRNNILLQDPQTYRAAHQEVTAQGSGATGPRPAAASAARAA